MHIFYTVIELKTYLLELRLKKAKIGFVPTMGALHQGHCSLISTAKKENDYVVCSIFVNPTQFNDKKDLEKYPRNLERDKEILQAAHCDILFAPSQEEMYPSIDNTKFDFGNLDMVMEAKFRPGHFNGVALIVKKLFNIVEPRSAYFGQKDFQQLLIIKHLVKMLQIPVTIVACPIFRESDGLAMSSRNVFLSPEERKNAPVIAQTLFSLKKTFSHFTINELKAWVKQQINKSDLMELEYFEIANSQTLLPIENIKETKHVVACIAVKFNKLRLIDNIILFP